MYLLDKRRRLKPFLGFFLFCFFQSLCRHFFPETFMSRHCRAALEPDLSHLLQAPTNEPPLLLTVYSVLILQSSSSAPSPLCSQPPPDPALAGTPTGFSLLEALSVAAPGQHWGLFLLARVWFGFLLPYSTSSEQMLLYCLFHQIHRLKIICYDVHSWYIVALVCVCVCVFAPFHFMESLFWPTFLSSVVIRTRWVEAYISI